MAAVLHSSNNHFQTADLMKKGLRPGGRAALGQRPRSKPQT